MEEKTYTEAEIYVRDHLLIQFIQLYFIENEYEIENLYKEWVRWLKEKEKEHGQRS